MTITPAKWTVNEYHSMIRAGLLDNRRVELLGGEIVEMPPEGEAHAYFSSEAEEYLRELFKGKATIRAGKLITLQDNSEPKPDIAIVQSLGREYLAHHPYPENIFWLIEYSNSSLDKDLNIKTRIYAEAGINEYWVVNLKRRQLIVFREPQDNEYLTRSTYSEGFICPLSFASISIAVSSIVSQ